MTPKLGKKPHVPDSRDVKLAAVLDDVQLPTPPVRFGYGTIYQDWQMLGNDKYGCCLAEGTLVSPGAVQKAYRIPYKGPMLTLIFASGKKLSVTPNHAVLTPRGFTKARLLKKGDYAIGATGPQLMASLHGGDDLDHAPAPVEEVFAALQRGADSSSVAQVVMESVDFHGDEEFVDGNVDVVAADRFLKREPLSAFRQPHGEQKVGTARESERVLHRDSSTLEGLFVRGSTSFGSVRGRGHVGALLDRPTRVSESERRALGANVNARLLKEAAELALVDAGFFREEDVSLASDVSLEEWREVSDLFLSSATDHVAPWEEFVASGFQPTGDGSPTDPELSSDLRERFPGLVATDQIVDVESNFHEGFVYDFSTDLRWFVADGIVTHNCVWAGQAHQVMGFNKLAGHPVSFTDKSVLSDYSAATGFDPDDPNTDQGTDVRAAVKYWQQTGVVDASGKRHRVGAYVWLKPGDYTELMQACFLFEFVGIGFAVQQAQMDQFNAGEPWDYVAGSPEVGGHYVVPTGRTTLTDNGLITWGRRQSFTRRFYEKLSDEAVVCVTEEELANGVNRRGLSLAKLNAALGQLR